MLNNEEIMDYINNPNFDAEPKSAYYFQIDPAKDKYAHWIKYKKKQYKKISRSLEEIILLIHKDSQYMEKPEELKNIIHQIAAIQKKLFYTYCSENDE